MSLYELAEQVFELERKRDDERTRQSFHFVLQGACRCLAALSAACEENMDGESKKRLRDHFARIAEKVHMTGARGDSPECAAATVSKAVSE